MPGWPSRSQALAEESSPTPGPPILASETPALPLAQPRTLSTFLSRVYRDPREWGGVWDQVKGLKRPQTERWILGVPLWAVQLWDEAG